MNLAFINSFRPHFLQCCIHMSALLDWFHSRWQVVKSNSGINLKIAHKFAFSHYAGFFLRVQLRGVNQMTIFWHKPHFNKSDHWPRRGRGGHKYPKFWPRGLWMTPNWKNFGSGKLCRSLHLQKTLPIYLKATLKWIINPCLWIPKLVICHQNGITLTLIWPVSMLYPRFIDGSLRAPASWMGALEWERILRARSLRKSRAQKSSLQPGMAPPSTVFNTITLWMNLGSIQDYLVGM